MKELVVIDIELANSFIDDLPNNLVKLIQIDNAGLYQIVGNQETVPYSEFTLQVIHVIDALEDHYNAKAELITHCNFQYVQFVKL
jgi:hypothetical protein